ncbi:helix-turn-helix domain-containing protein [Desulfallas sp. Bu1-1]|jgi:transcriptional regulator with XRE-family HTH domain|uniref:helix-turn-helix domain-containing protein n=1 Tax=Desulfallas sp. Bu1-1 TaxID=2787620 RepID=UPI00189EA6EE|nr:helix-turn-helix transcriptional regulator [Desulfallas sp. Bu1-1]MBF7082812.1 helix-turn-helix domain-containing protein [Desulfallas sp. Bu1-1]
MDLIRIGDKVISRHKIDFFINEILRLRSSGLSQTEVAGRLGIDRTFVSRLENMGEVRKGKSVAVVGFPIANREELFALLQREGVDFVLLMSESERWDFVRQKSGIELFNAIMELIAKAHSYDQVVVIGSDKRIKIIRAALDKEVVGLEIGESPLKEDKYVDPAEVLAIIRAIKARD